MSILIIKPGVLDTLQDLGRFGGGTYGLNPGGTMDRYASVIANMLTGNDINEAVLEIHFPGPQILFKHDALICITGADFKPTLNDEPLPGWQPVLIRKNTILQFSGKKQGSSIYLAVHGGFGGMQQWLNSYSTNLKAGLGGWQGKKLQKGDELSFRESTNDLSRLFRSESNFQLLPWRPDVAQMYSHPEDILFIRGNEFEALTGESKDNLLKSAFRVHPSSDRMGYQLKGKSLFRGDSYELLSSAVHFGTIQLLPNGQLIVLMADHQTTGGYPRIGHVISAHLPKFAQLSPGSSLRFTPVDIEAAEQLLFSQHQQLQILQRACSDHLNSYLC
ncbi:MAG: biotin-dependent carboxyltransferase family protein [Chitinophagaceae bacterium]